MPLRVPNLDDRTFGDLMKEALTLIPRYAPEWTDRNISDPGIALLELLAWMTETAIYQIDRVPDTSVEHFLRLVDTCRTMLDGREDVATATVRAVKALDERQPAITALEFETLARQLGAEGPTPVTRAKYLPLVDERCADAGSQFRRAPVMSVVIVVPDDPTSATPRLPQPRVDALMRGLKKRCLLATRLHVVGPEYVQVGVRTKVHRRPGSGLTEQQVQEVIVRFLHPLFGGPGGTGWPFGRWVYRSELFQVLEGMAQVDHVDALELSAEAPGVLHDEGIEIPQSALVVVPAGEINVTVNDVR